MFIFVILTIILWGIWGFFGKLATKYNSPLTITAISYFIAPLFSLFILLKIRGHTLNLAPLPLLLIFITTTTAVLGSIVYYSALSKGHASIVVSLTALYPVITICLSVLFLNEKFTFIQLVGFFMIFFGAVLINKF